MKKFTLKALLMAAALGMGGNAWADTETATLLNIDYTTVTTPAWTVVGGSGTISDGAWTHTHDGGSGARSAYLDWNLASSIEDNWSASFDVTVTTGSTWTQASDFQIAIASANATYTNNALLSSNVLLGARVATTKSNMGSDLACTITLNGADEENTVTLSHGVTYTFNITVDGTDLTASIKNGSTVIYSGSATLGSFVKPRGIYDLLPRPYNSGWGVYSSKYDNIKVTKEVEAGAVEVPSAKITAVNGIKRTVTFTCATEGVDFSYSTDGGSTYTDGSSLEISENTTIYVKATKGSTSAVSEGLAFEAGTEIKLNTPTWTKTGYNAGVSTVTLSSNQNNVLLAPVAAIYYKIDDGTATEYTSAISVNDGEVLTYYAVASGYTNSDAGSVTAVAPCSEPIVFTESYSRSSDGNISVNTEEVVTTIGGSNTPYYYMYCDGVHVGEYLITSSKSIGNWLLRTGGIYGGNTQGYAIRGVKKGDYVTINFSRGDGNPSSSGDGTLDEWNSTSTSCVFYVTSTMGNFRFNMPRYGYIKSITVQRALATSGATIGSTGYATFAADVDLDLSTLTDGFTAFYASGVADNAVTLTETTDNVVAGTGLVIKGSGAFTVTETREGASELADNLLVGCPTATTINNTTTGYANFYVLSATVAEFQNLKKYIDEGNSVTIPAGKAYLNAPATLAKLRVIFESEDATAITAIEATDAVNNGVIYNLSGQRVVKPLKGIYIQNGKKFIVK